MAHRTLERTKRVLRIARDTEDGIIKGDLLYKKDGPEKEDYYFGEVVRNGKSMGDRYVPIKDCAELMGSMKDLFQVRNFCIFHKI
jgi:hypothetical protein